MHRSRCMTPVWRPQSFGRRHQKGGFRIGGVFAAFAGARLLCNVPAGLLADRCGRRLLLIGSPLLMALGGSSGLATGVAGMCAIGVLAPACPAATWALLTGTRCSSFRSCTGPLAPSTTFLVRMASDCIPALRTLQILIAGRLHNMGKGHSGPLETIRCNRKMAIPCCRQGGRRAVAQLRAAGGGVGGHGGGRRRGVGRAGAVVGRHQPASNQSPDARRQPGETLQALISDRGHERKLFVSCANLGHIMKAVPRLAQPSPPARHDGRGH